MAAGERRDGTLRSRNGDGDVLQAKAEQILLFRTFPSSFLLAEVLPSLSRLSVMLICSCDRLPQ